jgi:hypothetical protein
MHHLHHFHLPHVLLHDHDHLQPTTILCLQSDSSCDTPHRCRSTNDGNSPVIAATTSAVVVAVAMTVAVVAVATMAANRKVSSHVETSVVDKTAEAI